MANQIGNDTDKVEIDSWEAAFAALEQKDAKDPESAAAENAGRPDDEDAAQPGGQQQSSSETDGVDGARLEGVAGDAGDDSGNDSQELEDSGRSLFSRPEVDLGKFEEDLGARVRNQAIDDIAAEFLKRNVRSHDGILGATLDDEDICKRDEDGVPRFYNPETGREFSGDNPRRQAQEWVDDYNKELARVFNEACAKYEAKLMEQHAPELAVMKFAPTYNGLDPIRKGMLDNVLQDYEVKDSEGKLVGYSCDLDKALALVERQVAMIQGYAKEHGSAQQQQAAPSTPALDMKTSSGAVGSDDAPPKSLEEAMLRQQDAMLASLRK